MGQTETWVSPPWNSERSCWTLRCWSDVTLTVYQGKPRKNVCILSTVYTGVGTFTEAKANPVCDVLCQHKVWRGCPGPEGEGMLRFMPLSVSPQGSLFHLIWRYLICYFYWSLTVFWFSVFLMMVAEGFCTPSLLLHTQHTKSKAIPIQSWTQDKTEESFTCWQELASSRSHPGAFQYLIGSVWYTVIKDPEQQ